MDFKIIAVDFDGTLCEDKWPEIGAPNKELIAYLKEQKATGAKLILWTCRVDDLLQNAVRWSSEQGLIFDTVNENLPEVLQWMGGDTRKIFANEYIDDRNFEFRQEGHISEELIYRSVNDPMWDNLFQLIEKALGFKLFFWQKTYIMGLGYRCYGETTAHILKTLVGDRISTPIYLNRPKNQREDFYQHELIEIKRKLDAKGIISRSVERRSWK